MSDLKWLDELERLEKTATEAPWSGEKPGKDPDGWSMGVAVATTYGRQMIYAEAKKGQKPAADKELIIDLRNFATHLFAEAREADRLRALLREAMEAIEGGDSTVCELEAVATKIRAELEPDAKGGSDAH